jgi:intracellular multiplication protein IcmP
MSGSLRTRQNSLEEAGLALVFMIILVGGLLFFGWFKAHALISLLVLAILHAELWPASLWTHSVDQARQAMATAHPATVTLHQIVLACAFVGRVYRIPVTLFLAGLAALTIWKAPGERFARPLDFEGLMKLQVLNFPSIAAFLERSHSLVRPGTEAVRPADFALHLGEWIALYALDAEGRYDPIAAHGALVAQLGPVWRGLDEATPQVRAMVAVFGLHAARERDEARLLLGVLSTSLAPLTPEEAAQQDRKADPLARTGPTAPLVLSPDALAAVDAVLHRPEIVHPALAEMATYAFTSTALMGLLMHARARAGVLAPGQFAFLKLVDRPLWYALHSLGFPLTITDYGPQPNARIEALGSRAHWEAERAVRQRLPRPRMEMATEAINQRLRDATNRGRPIKETR